MTKGHSRDRAGRIGAAFDDAANRAERAIANGMKSQRGGLAAPELARLKADLERERPLAVARGWVDPEWARSIIRDVAEWAPMDDVSLLSALGVLAQLRKPR